jgi:hypothetical protein
MKSPVAEVAADSEQNFDSGGHLFAGPVPISVWMAWMSQIIEGANVKAAAGHYDEYRLDLPWAATCPHVFVRYLQHPDVFAANYLELVKKHTQETAGMPMIVFSKASAATA